LQYDYINFFESNAFPELLTRMEYIFDDRLL